MVDVDIEVAYHRWLRPKIINYQIRKLAEIDRHEEFVAADFDM